MTRARFRVRQLWIWNSANSRNGQNAHDFWVGTPSRQEVPSSPAPPLQRGQPAGYNRTKKFMCSPLNRVWTQESKHFRLVNRLVVPMLTAFSKSLCVKSLCAFFLRDLHALNWCDLSFWFIISQIHGIFGSNIECFPWKRIVCVFWPDSPTFGPRKHKLHIGACKVPFLTFSYLL